MSRSASVSVPRRELYVVPERRTSLELEDVPRLIGGGSSVSPREYDSWPCDSFFLLPDAVLSMDAGTFRADLMSIDPALSASLPEWHLPGHIATKRVQSPAPDSPVKMRPPRATNRPDRRSLSLLDNHEGLMVQCAGQGTVLIGGGGDGRGGNSSTNNIGGEAPTASTAAPPTSTNRRDSTQKDAYWFCQEGNNSTTNQKRPSTLESPNEIFFGTDKSSGLSYKDREERVRQLRERQQQERTQKLEELKEQAAAAQKFREQQEQVRKQRLEDIRQRDAERRSQVEERKRMIYEAEQERREAVLRKTAEKESRIDTKRRNERSSIVFAFGSSTPRMLDPKETCNSSYYGPRRATSTTNVHLADTSNYRHSSDRSETDLGRKRATSAHGLDRKPDDLRMSSSMYEVFHWDENCSPTKEHRKSLTSQGDEDLMTRSMTAAVPTAARRRTDLMPAMPAFRDGSRGSPRHRSPGMSGTVTPNSPSRPASALSQGSTGSTVSLRPRTSPRKPRPLSIAGSTPSAADKPKHASGVSPPRESRSTERKLSVGSATPSRPSRAKSAGSDGTPGTPGRTAKPSTVKKTPAQVKAESNAKKSIEKTRSTPRSKGTPKTTPLHSPAIETKGLPGSESRPRKSQIKSKASASKENLVSNSSDKDSKENIKENKEKENEKEKETTPPVEENENKENVINNVEEKIEAELQAPTTTEGEAKVDIKENVEQETKEDTKPDSVEEQQQKPTNQNEKNEKPSVQNEEEEKNDEVKDDKVDDSDKAMAQKAAEKPVTGYASEEEYKAALAEKRRLAREAREREQELERQRELEEQERERREEEEYLRLMDEQKKAEEERLKKAIEEADRQREEEAKRKEEEEKQRIENEKIEEQKRKETEERLRREEEERKERKNRVAAIMARTRSKGGSSTPSKAESKTPSEENKSILDSGLTGSMTESMIANMTDSMIEAVVESRKSPVECDTEPTTQNDTCNSQVTVTETVITQSNESSSQKIESLVTTKLVETHVNGDSPVPMETTPTQNVDLLGSLNGVHSVNHNGIDNSSTSTMNESSNKLISGLGMDTSTETTTTATNFEQIIDLNQTKLTNEDAINSNPSTPFIAFEQNLNHKTQENSAVPDLLL